MADANHIAAALVALEEEATQLELLMQVFDELAGDQTPAWVAVLSTRITPLTARIDAIGDIVRRDLLPLQRDIQSLTRQGGMGAVAPMVTKAPVGQSITSRT